MLDQARGSFSKHLRFILNVLLSPALQIFLFCRTNGSKQPQSKKENEKEGERKSLESMNVVYQSFTR